MPCPDSARLLRPYLMRQAGWLPAERLRLWDTWRLRTPPKQLAEPRAYGGPDRHVEVPDPSAGVRMARGGPGPTCGGPDGTWRSRIHLRGSGSAATGAEHFHLWDTW